MREGRRLTTVEAPGDRAKAGKSVGLRAAGPSEAVAEAELHRVRLLLEIDRPGADPIRVGQIHLMGAKIIMVELERRRPIIREHPLEPKSKGPADDGLAAGRIAGDETTAKAKKPVPSYQVLNLDF